MRSHHTIHWGFLSAVGFPSVVVAVDVAVAAACSQEKRVAVPSVTAIPSFAAAERKKIRE